MFKFQQKKRFSFCVVVWHSWVKTLYICGDFSLINSALIRDVPSFSSPKQQKHYYKCSRKRGIYKQRLLNDHIWTTRTVFTALTDCFHWTEMWGRKKREREVERARAARFTTAEDQKGSIEFWVSSAWMRRRHDGGASARSASLLRVCVCVCILLLLSKHEFQGGK